MSYLDWIIIIWLGMMAGGLLLYLWLAIDTARWLKRRHR